MEKGTLFVISGPSGAGKGTVLNRVKESMGLVVAVSATTRKPRTGEQHGLEYYFKAEEEFKQAIENQEFVEWTKYSGNYYGTLKSEIKKHINAGKNIVLEIETEGAANIKKAFADAVMVFIAPPSLEVLQQRLTDRKTNTGDEIALRMQTAKKEMERMPEYDYIALNDNLDECVKAVEAIVELKLITKAGNL
jgi:guanylate kinase